MGRGDAAVSAPVPETADTAAAPAAPAAPAGLEPGAPCANCGAPVPERFCSRCGQDRGLTPHVPLREIVGEALGEALSVDGRMARTIVPFLFRPGFLTAEYLAGRRVRYSSPLRLYLLTTLLFFLAASLGPDQPGLQSRGKDGGFVIGYTVDPEPATGTPAAAGAAGPSGPAPAERKVLVGGSRELTEAERVAVRDEVARLRTKGDLFSRLMADRIERLGALPPGEASRQVSQAILAQTPRVLLFLVPVMAGLLALLYRGRRRFYAEHFVFALHAHALGFALLVPGEALASRWLTATGAGLAALHVLLALRRVYGAGWWATGLRFAGLALAYLVALGLGLGVAALLGLLLL